MYSTLPKLVFLHSPLYIAGSNNNLLLFPSFWKCLSSLWNTHCFYSYITHFCTSVVNNSIPVPFVTLSLTHSSRVIYYFSVPPTTWLMRLLSRCRPFILGHFTHLILTSSPLPLLPLCPFFPLPILILHMWFDLPYTLTTWLQNKWTMPWAFSSVPDIDLIQMSKERHV